MWGERERESVRMHGARSGPSGVFKARSVAPSRGMRQSIITVLHIDTTVGHTGPRGAEPRASSQRQRQRGERAREEGAHTLDRVQGCPPLSAAPRYPPWPHTRTRGPTNDIGSSIILVPRISSARYCHRERLMFRPGPSPSSPLSFVLSRPRAVVISLSLVLLVTRIRHASSLTRSFAIVSVTIVTFAPNPLARG